MQALKHGYRGLSLLAQLNWDRVLSILAVVVSLSAAAYILSH